MPYWIASTLAATPALAWIFLALGLPWALIALPRRDWRERALVACLTLAFGPALLTAWMFALGTLGSLSQAPLMRLDTTLIGTAFLAAVGWFLVWRKARTTPATVRQSTARPGWDERLLIGLIALALLIRWLGIAYWPSTAYDALWVYAYQGKLHALLGYIPQQIGYYPQFLQLQHSFIHLAVGGVDDHAARAVLPWLHLGSILAAYALGKLLVDQRTGVYLAAVWALYPHMGEWSRYGDLEVIVAFLFTGAAAFFLKAWLNPEERVSARRYALIAGALLGIGLWSKPTMGAFIWGVMVLTTVELLRCVGQGGGWRASLQQWWPRLQIAIWAGLACIPLGGAWYVRNVAFGHAPVDFPPGEWLERAARSGVEFGWPLLALLLLCGWAARRMWTSGARASLRGLLLGLALVLGALLPSIINTGRVGVVENRMGLLEWAALAGGVLALALTLRAWSRSRWTAEGQSLALGVTLASLLALPYFITWFYSYSYHYRLSFAMVPLLVLPTAILLARWTRTWLAGVGWLRPVALALSAIALATPGIINPLYDPNAGWDWLWTDKLPDDHARHRSGNAALMAVVDGLQIYLDTRDEPLRVVAPGARQIPFFFPLEDIRIDRMPTQLSELEGVTYFIYGVPESGGDFPTFTPGQNPVLDLLALAAPDEGEARSPLRKAWWYDDGIFKYTVYELYLDRLTTLPTGYAPAQGDVQFGGIVRLLGYDLIGPDIWEGRKMWMHFYWEVLQPTDRDYSVYIHLRDPQGDLVRAWDGPISWWEDGNYYSSRVWKPGQFVVDRRVPRLLAPMPPLGEGYQLVIGLYDRETSERLPMTVDGVPAGDGWTLPQDFSVVPGKEG